MNLKVVHKLSYTYSEAVILDPHSIYLYPKLYPHQQLRSYSLTIEPEPGMLVHNIDAEGNHQQIAYFRTPTDQLSISVQMTVASEDVNVFGFVLFPFETERLPFQYPEALKKHLQPYLVREGVTTYVEQYARQMGALARWMTVPFLTTLCREICQNFVYERRDAGAPLPPEHTLIGRKGSCRDFAQFFIACCRSVGIAARFVSGYLYGNILQEHDLHAWAEVYLPGAGWRGFDPTEGRAIVNNHVYLASSSDPTLVAPVSGAFRGRAKSTLFTNVNVEEG
ncbi:MAG: transglutaminase family protein [Spirosomataceae bacterium]